MKFSHERSQEGQLLYAKKFSSPAARSSFVLKIQYNTIQYNTIQWLRPLSIPSPEIWSARIPIPNPLFSKPVIFKRTVVLSQ